MGCREKGVWKNFGQPSLPSATRHQGDPIPSDTVAVLEATQVPCLAHGST